MNFAETFFASCPYLAEATIKVLQIFNFFIAGIWPFFQKLWLVWIIGVGTLQALFRDF